MEILIAILIPVLYIVLIGVFQPIVYPLLNPRDKSDQNFHAWCLAVFWPMAGIPFLISKCGRDDRVARQRSKELEAAKHAKKLAEIKAEEAKAIDAQLNPPRIKTVLNNGYSKSYYFYEED